MARFEVGVFALGNRHGKPIVYTVHSKLLHEDGYKFYLSVNGVRSTKEVPVKYLEKNEK